MKHKGKLKHKGKAINIWEPPGYRTPPPDDRVLKVFLTPQRNEVERFAVGLMELGPAKNSGLHMHEEAEEVWYVVSGRGLVQLGDDLEPVQSGTIVYGPAGVPHQFINDSDSELVAIWYISPAGDEAFILEALSRQEAEKGQPLA